MTLWKIKNKNDKAILKHRDLNHHPVLFLKNKHEVIVFIVILN